MAMKPIPPLDMALSQGYAPVHDPMCPKTEQGRAGRGIGLALRQLLQLQSLRQRGHAHCLRLPTCAAAPSGGTALKHD